MDPDDQQLVGRLSFDELSTDTAEMEAGGAEDSSPEVVPTAPWYVRGTVGDALLGFLTV